MSLKRRRLLILVHIGKTAGSSVVEYSRRSRERNNLEALRLGHRTASEILEEVGQEQWDAALKYSIVRNPIDRYISACRQCGVDANDPAARKLAAGQDRRFVILRSQYDFLYINDSLAVDKVFKFEQDVPDGVVTWLNSHLVGRGPFPHIDRARKRASKQELTAETEAWVNDFYRKDFEAFGYRHTTSLN